MEVHSPQSESLLSEPTLQGDTSNVGHRGTLSVWINRLVRRILSSPGLDLFWQAGHESSGGVGLGLCVGLRGKSARERRLSMAQVHLRGFVANSALPAFRQVVGRARVRCTAAICPRLSRLALQNHSQRQHLCSKTTLAIRFIWESGIPLQPRTWPNRQAQLYICRFPCL